MDYIDDEDSSSDEDEGEDEEESTGDAPSAGLRKKIRKYLQLAATVQNSLARVASVRFKPALFLLGTVIS